MLAACMHAWMDVGMYEFMYVFGRSDVLATSGVDTATLAGGFDFQRGISY